MTKIAILGIGAMGSRMAKRLLAAGHAVSVWNRNRERALPLAAEGARIAETPGDAVAGVDFALGMSRDDESSRRIWLEEDGALSEMPAGAIAIESATVTVQWARELAGQCAKQKVDFIDAPVAGSRPQAEAGQLIFLVGGNEAVVRKSIPILELMGGAVHHAGPAGSGAAMKLAVNALFGIQAAAVAELLGLLERSGVDKTRGMEILGATPVISPAAKLLGGAMLKGQFNPLFPIDLVEKDFGYVVETAAQEGAETPMSHKARQVFAQAKNAGHGDLNITGVAKLYE